jgi:beta-N-acetylhexosaminidase
MLARIKHFERTSLRTMLMSLAIAAAAIGAIPANAATLDQMAGQMVLVGFQGAAVSDPGVQTLISEIKSGEVGGLMYLRVNVKSLDAVKAMNAAFVAASPSLKPFITLDQEGGKVQRLSSKVGFTEMPSAEDVAKDDTPDQAEKIYAKTATGLAGLGFNVNFGPVVDLNVNPDNPIIGKYGRSFSADPAKVIAYADAFIEAQHAAGVLTALKHFPGHGSSTTDSHKGFVDVTATWKPVELQPYKTLVGQGGIDFVMIGHLYIDSYGAPADPQQLPASLSPYWIGKILRGQIGYKGAVISDDLEMGAIRDMFKSDSNDEIIRQTVVKAVNAGVNVLLFSNTAVPSAGLGAKIHDILVSEAKKDPAFAKKIEASYNLIVALKKKLGA